MTSVTPVGFSELVATQPFIVDSFTDDIFVSMSHLLSLSLLCGLPLPPSQADKADEWSDRRTCNQAVSGVYTHSRLTARIF